MCFSYDVGIIRGVFRVVIICRCCMYKEHNETRNLYDIHMDDISDYYGSDDSEHVIPEQRGAIIHQTQEHNRDISPLQRFFEFFTCSHT